MSNDEARMTFVEHLAELRIRIVRSAVALIIGFLICYAFSEQLFHIVARPLILPNEPPAAQTAAPESAGGDVPPAPAKPNKGVEWVTLNVLEGFLVRMKLAGYCGLLLAFPYILYQACAFVFPGLKPNERRAVLILLWGCSILGILGTGVAYVGVLPLVLPYLIQWAPDIVTTQLRMSENVALILKFYLAFAIAFQFPMVVLILVYMDLLSPQTLKKYRRVAIVGMAVAAAVLTPPDYLSMLILLFPLVVLYEISIWAAYIVVRFKRKRAQTAG